MKKLVLFFSCYRQKLLGFLVYYILYALFLWTGTVKGWPMLLLNAFLLLFMLSISVGTERDHTANFQAFRRQPMTAQDIPSAEGSPGVGLWMGVFLCLPPALYLIVTFLIGRMST
jgi:hypothetical protein